MYEETKEMKTMIEKEIKYYSKGKICPKCGWDKWKTEACTGRVYCLACRQDDPKPGFGEVISNDNE